ncbi:MAG: septum formation protein Maf [Deltaproteobacteria bacterium]|nr:septum formation protein Maf [Deltaproteobacteria bacterium]
MREKRRALVLASSSPRRRELLAAAGFAFEIAEPDIDEVAGPGEAPEAQARRLALEKAHAVAARFPEEACVLAADTLVVVDEDVLGKPRDPDEAVEMMLRIQGRTHRVLTGFAFVVRALGVVESDVVESVVRMHAVDRDTARAYARSGEPLDKAGAYAAQGEGGRFVAGISGSRSNVIGLPMESVVARLAGLGVAPE